MAERQLPKDIFNQIISANTPDEKFKVCFWGVLFLRSNWRREGCDKMLTLNQVPQLMMITSYFLTRDMEVVLLIL